jgi:DNA topoisomerase I
MRLLIVESPNKVKKIKEILGAGWEVAASVGHIRDLPSKELGVQAPEYRPQYELTDRGGDVVKRLRVLVGKADEVYLATDPDREGEAIAWHLQEALKLRAPRRVRFDAITPEVIRRAVAAPRSIDPALVHAQEARRVLDRLVGYQVSPVLSRQTGQRGLSAGRVQSPALRLVVEREREIESFREVNHFGAELSFAGGSWRAQWETAPFLPKRARAGARGDGAAPAARESDAPEYESGSQVESSAPGPDSAAYILDRALAERAAACRLCTVLASANRQVRESPPPPFTTSTMLQAASVRLRWRPEATAAVGQRLFEAGLITYHRTDSQNFSAEGLAAVRGYAEEHRLPLPPTGRRFRSKESAQEAHEAVRPTHFADERAGEDREQEQLYRLIWERAVASQLADAVWSVNTTRLQARSPVPNPLGAEEIFTF